MHNQCTKEINKKRCTNKSFKIERESSKWQIRENLQIRQGLHYYHQGSPFPSSKLVEAFSNAKINYHIWGQPHLLSQCLPLIQDFRTGNQV
jgi:hypothetical protein